MKRMILWIVIALFVVMNAFAQEGGQAIVFIWNDELMAQSIEDNRLVTSAPLTAAERQVLLETDRNGHSIHDSPLVEILADGYGFYQGVWSENREQFVFLAIDPDAPNYRLIMWENGQQNILFSGQVNETRGYLVPIG